MHLYGHVPMYHDIVAIWSIVMVILFKRLHCII